MPKSRRIKVKFEPNRPEGQNVARPILRTKKSNPTQQEQITTKG